MNADRQTDGRMDGRTDSHIRPHARAHAHTRTLACLHAHTMHSGTYARTDRQTRTCSYGGKHPSTNMEVRKLEVRSKMLEIRNVAHALMNACMYEQTFRRTNMHADRQTDGRTGGRTDSQIRPHSRAHARTQMLACLHGHTMHSGTYARTDRHTHTCSYGGKHPSTNIKVRC